MTIIEYVIEEVRRQGHDIHARDGIYRVSWMLDAWAWAIGRSHNSPTVGDAIALGTIIEPDKNAHGIRRVGVRVGSHICPSYGEVSQKLKDLFKVKDIIMEGTDVIPHNKLEDSLDFYEEFELIHPFVDGNGRTGKILLNWLNGTLLDPVFPPRDFWGKEIENP